ncbi:hypothetical protein ACMYR3_06300 [Ampullimonas aquatilis]|uniref:hypothetical protein n=1 Tax=Ampullimonas aquatilis TaxID=1341549 RepID=UPI003C78212B
MSYIRKTYAYTQDGKQVVFNGHITVATAIKRNFKTVSLSIHDASGKGRGETRTFDAPFANMKSFH